MRQMTAVDGMLLLRLLSSVLRQDPEMIAFLADTPIDRATRLPSVAHSSKKPQSVSKKMETSNTAAGAFDVS